MRYKSEICAIACFVEESHATNQTHHGRQVFGIRKTNGNQHGAGHDTGEMDPGLLYPERVGVLVEQIANEAAGWPGDDVEETEHGCPPAAAGLAKGGEVLQVVGAQNRIDCKFPTERAEISCRERESLEGEDDREQCFRIGLLNDLPSGNVDHVVVSGLSLLVRGAVGFALEVHLRVVSGSALGSLFAHQAGCHLWAGRLLSGRAVVDSQMTLGPFAGRGVGAKKQHSNGSRGDQDEWNDEGNSPRLAWRKTLSLDECVIDCRHNEADSPLVLTSKREQIARIFSQQCTLGR